MMVMVIMTFLSYHQFLGLLSHQQKMMKSTMTMMVPILILTMILKMNPRVNSNKKFLKDYLLIFFCF